MPRESTISKRSTSVDVRLATGIVRSPLDEVKAIQTLLADVYKDAGDGRTLFRELVQNADDAGARSLQLVVLERGWPDARNSLLHGPALLVANDGAFKKKDDDALHNAIGGSKEDLADKIGTFGIGLKSVFHLCEAFLYVGAAGSRWRAGALNPWAGTGEDDGGADPLHPDWDKVDDERLRSAATELLPDRSDGFLLWIPLRRHDHRDRGAEGRRYGLGEHCPKPDELCAWFGRSTPAALLLAQCGDLHIIDAARATGPESLRDRVRLVRVTRPPARWVGRYRNDTPEFSNRTFEGKITAEKRNWSVVGIETLGSPGLRELRSRSDWPHYPRWARGRYSTKPRQALAHAAVTVLRPRGPGTEQLGARLRWAAFLPLDDDPEPVPSAIVESKGVSPAWEITLHGYFWPLQDRRSIPGVTNDVGGVAIDSDMRSRWNRAVCDDVLLPLLPSVLANAAVGVDECVARRLLKAVVRSDMFKNRLPQVRQQHWLLPIVTANGVRWKALDANACPVLSIPNWSGAPETVRRQFVASCDEGTDDVVFVDDDAPRFADELDDWTDDRLERLLNCIPRDTFEYPKSVGWIEEFVRHALDRDSCTADTRATTVARWLVGRIGEGVLTHTTRRSAPQESRNELREAWRGLCEALPKGWRVEAPLDSQQAVAELAAGGLFGVGLLPVPFGQLRDESPPTSWLDQERLDRALSTLGRLLGAGGDSERLRRSRLLLAEALLSRRADVPMCDLDRLPLLQATRLPADYEEAWSVVDLRQRVESRRVFARAQTARLPDPKQAVTELAEALHEPAWLVNGDAAVSVTGEVPSPLPEALASAVLRAEAFADVAGRKPLLERLAPDARHSASVRWAIRALLAGHTPDVVERDTGLFHDRAGFGHTLRILLRLLDRPWCAVRGELVESLSQDVLEALSVSQADHQALHGLLDACLHRSADWAGVTAAEALQLLRDLHSAEPQAWVRWRAMPLHRGVDGARGAFDDRSRRSTGKEDELRLPRELEAEVRVLAPEPEVVHLYDSVPHMDRDGLLQLMLDNSSPWRFFDQIVQGVRSSEGQMALPQDGGMRDLLKVQPWLPNRNGGGIAPDAVLIAPKELLDAVAGLAAANAFGDKRLPDSVDSKSWGAAEPVVRGLLGRLSRERQIQRIIDALESDRIGQVEDGAWLTMPEPDLVDTPLVADALQTSLAGSHPGWKMVHAVAHLLGDGDDPSQVSPELSVKAAKALCAPISLERQVEILTTLAGVRPPRDSPGRRLFDKFLQCFAETAGRRERWRSDAFFMRALPELDLPTQDGNWHASREVARTETVVARRHRLVPELRPILRLSGDDPIHIVGSAGNGSIGTGLDALERYFEPWRGRVRHGAVGAFLSLLGNGLHNRIWELAQQWLGEDVAIPPMAGLDRDAISVWVSPRVARGDQVSAVNVLGLRVEMGADADVDTLFAVDPVPQPPSQFSALAPLGSFWEIALRDVDPSCSSSSDLLQVLKGTVERWATRYLELPREQVTAWWSQWGEGSQADFGPVVASIKAYLPLTLQHLDVKESEPLRKALRQAEQAQRKREQAPSQETLRVEQEALNRLEPLIREHQGFLWRRVKEVMRRYGYGRDSVLLELAQNADDALAEATEINGGPLAPATRRLLIRVHEHDGARTVDVIHWGRPINDTGGATFPAGRERQWDQDLYFMLLMNLSGKPGEEPGESSSSSTTGRFGLGFKSVHLVSSSPSVVSDFIAFSIAGGLLPQEDVVPGETDSLTIEGRRPTRIRLPLHPVEEAPNLIDQLFLRFAYARVLLPAFARQIREVVVEGGPAPGAHAFDGVPIDGAPGWSVGAETELPKHVGRWRVLRFRPADAGRDLSTGALAVGLQEGVPTAFEGDVPFLWNVMPTSENWGCGYVVNGPFKLDPGRTHVSLDDNTTRRTVARLGEALGRGLVDLHNVLTEPDHASHIPLGIRDGRSFLSSLWQVLACGLGNEDEKRRGFLLELHGSGRGLSAWMSACSAAPTGLSAPFRPVIPPLTSDVRIEVASDELDNHVCAVLAAIEDEDLAALVGHRCIVSAEIEQLLYPLCNLAGFDGDRIAPTLLRPSSLFAELVERWGSRLTPARLHALRPIDGGGDSNFDLYDPQGVTWRRALMARAVDGSLRPIRSLLVRDVPGSFDDVGADGDDELLRAAFAPDDRVLDPTYIQRSEDWRVFRWLRDQHRVDAAAMAGWCAELPEPLHPPAIHYVLYGELGSSLLRHLEPIEERPRWLRQYDAVRRLVEGQCEEPWRRKSLLVALFPDRFPDPEPHGDQDPPDSDAFFEKLLEWWDDDAVRREVISDYERATWPDWLRRDGIVAGLRGDSVDHWLALLVMGACQSLGRAQDHHHRSFLELAHNEGWWEVFKTPDDTGAWMGVLRDWQDDALAKLTYPRWMSLFPAIFQLSRYRHEYVRLLKSAGRRSEGSYRVNALLAPRIDEALTGAGAHFDAPPAPLNMGLHWVLRELVRMEIVGGEHLFPDCWVPSEQVLSLLAGLGFGRPDAGVPNFEKARAVFNFLVPRLRTEAPNLHLAFDIPLRYIASGKGGLRQRLGLGPPQHRTGSDGVRHRTSRGELVRSKSEVIIANELLAKGIKYEYERRLTLQDGTSVLPDFTIRRPDGACFYWEHLGMLENPDYLQRWEEKLKRYRQSGIAPVEERGYAGALIVTREDRGGIDSGEVTGMILRYLSRLG